MADFKDEVSVALADDLALELTTARDRIIRGGVTTPR
jgi:hypothetical protein